MEQDSIFASHEFENTEFSFHTAEENSGIPLWNANEFSSALFENNSLLRRPTNLPLEDDEEEKDEELDMESYDIINRNSQMNSLQDGNINMID